VSAIKQAAAARAARTPDPVAEMVTEAGKHLPSVVRLEDVLGIPVIEVIERLNQVVANLDLLIDHAKTDDGKVRNAQFLLNATDRLRACLETTLKIHKAMRDLDRVDSLHNAILEEITKEAPEAAERILRRIGTIAGQWGGLRSDFLKPPPFHQTRCWSIDSTTPAGRGIALDLRAAWRPVPEPVMRSARMLTRRRRRTACW
jgi:hypothetical protein